MNPRMDALDDRTLADELAHTFQDELAIHALMLTAGIDAARLPRLGMNAPIDYWVFVMQKLKVGAAGEGALDRLLLTAAERMPGNRTLRAAAIRFGIHWSDVDDADAKRAVAAGDKALLASLVDRLIANVLAAEDTTRPDPAFSASLRAEVEHRLVEATELEAVWNEVRYKPLSWLLVALERSRTVARIGRTLEGGIGTGFRFPGSWLGPYWEDKALLLTNAHVVSPEEHVRAAVSSLAPHEACVAFFGTDGRVVAEGAVTRCLWTSPPDDLDASLLELDCDLSTIPEAPLYARPDLAGVNRINVIGHPNGREKQVSLQDNLLDRPRTTSKRLYYSSPTDPGSSGSPLFANEDWAVVGIHHRSDADARLNCGTPIASILEAMEAAGLTSRGAS